MSETINVSVEVPGIHVVGAVSDGDSIVWNASSGQWEPGAGGGVTPETVYEALLPLGKISPSFGVQGGPVLYDPSSADPGDAASLWFVWNPTVRNLLLELNADDGVNGESYGGFNVFAGTEDDPSVATRLGSMFVGVDDDAYDAGLYMDVSVQMRRDGSSPIGKTELNNYGSGYSGFYYKHPHGASDGFALSARAESGQTDPLLNLKAADGTSEFRILPTGSFGSFGVTPPAQSAAGTTAADAIACLKAFGLMHA